MKKFIFLALFITGCGSIRDHVFVNTDTVLGLEAAQNPVTGLYQARLGYARAEIALVPTNNVDVITELRWNSIFTTGGLYQRTAIGKNACEQSIYMFMRDHDGKIDPAVLTNAVSLLAAPRGAH